MEEGLNERGLAGSIDIKWKYVGQLILEKCKEWAMDNES
jgi:hypothetical protein